MAGVIFGRGGSNQSAAYQPITRIVSPDFLNQAFPPLHGIMPPGVETPIPPDPTVSAAFSVDFTAASPSLPSQLTLTRASSATYFDVNSVMQTATSNVARFDYAKASHSARGLFIEEGRTNSIANKDFSTWTITNGGTPDLVVGAAVTSVDGNTNAYPLTPSAVFRPHMAHGSGSVTTASPIVYSCYVKANGYTQIGLRESAITGHAASFNLVTKQIYYNGPFSGGMIEPVGNGVFRVSALYTPSGSGTYNMGVVVLDNIYQGSPADPFSYNYTGDGTSGIIVQFPQMEVVSVSTQFLPTSYIYTSGSAASRSADIVSSTDATWLTYKGWAIETEAMQPDADATMLGVNTVIGLGYSSGDVVTTADGGTQSGAVTLSPDQVNRAVLAWDSTPRVSITSNGNAVTTAANTPATPTTLYFGNTNNGASGFLNGRIRMLGGYTTLSDAQMVPVSYPGASFTGVTAAANITYAATLGALTQALTGTVLDAAAVAQTLGALGQTAPATVSNAAVVAQTLGALTQIATDAVLAQATTTQTLGALGQAATATAIDTATVAQTLGALSQTAALTSQMAITVAQNLGALVQSAAATHPDTIAVAQTLGALVQAATAGVIDTATAAQTLGALAQAATASAPAGLTATQTLGALGQTVTAADPVAIAAAQTLGALAQAATVTHPDTAAVTQTLGALAQTATGGPVDTASVAQTLGALVQAATATLTDARSIDAAQTLGALGQALTGTVVDTATVAQSLGALSQSVAVTHPDTASVAQTLGAITQALTGQVIDTATVNQALGALNQTATVSTTSGFVAAQTLGGLVQALTGTVVSHATIAQALGGLQQTTTGGPVARIGAYTDALPPLGQAATASIPRIVTVAQALGAISQAASLNVPDANAAVAQILGALGQAATSTVGNRLLAAQVLGALTQSARVRSTPPTHIHLDGRLRGSAALQGRLSAIAALQGRLGSRVAIRGRLE